MRNEKIKKLDCGHVQTHGSRYDYQAIINKSHTRDIGSTIKWNTILWWYLLMAFHAVFALYIVVEHYILFKNFHIRGSKSIYSLFLMYNIGRAI